MASSKLRTSSCSFLNLLLSFFNFILFLLSAASFAPPSSSKPPDFSRLGLSLDLLPLPPLLLHRLLLSLLLHNPCLPPPRLLRRPTPRHLSPLPSSLSMLKSPRDPREAKLLVRLECGVLMAMFVMQLAVALLCCVVHSCWVREYRGLEAERDAMAEKRRRKIARVQEESMANAARIAEVRGMELEEKMKSKYGAWGKNDLEG
ncbi:UNVERIFIED_CONTAM: hypothetical protein Scaly_1691600 [Sesamum calycinum]|uniref:Uncharacterized protein n=1 Tax=Sesamum calycinum TaxID=2727403 RepID=A0AAW2NU90_9LAMI